MDRPPLDPRAVVRPASTPAPASAVPANAATTSGRSPITGPRAWRCHACSALLGVEHNGELHVKYKEVQHWIRGRCRHACRRCGAMNTLLVAGAPAPITPEGGAR